MVPQTVCCRRPDFPKEEFIGQSVSGEIVVGTANPTPRAHCAQYPPFPCSGHALATLWPRIQLPSAAAQRAHGVVLVLWFSLGVHNRATEPLGLATRGVALPLIHLAHEFHSSTALPRPPTPVRVSIRTSQSTMQFQSHATPKSHTHTLSPPSMACCHAAMPPTAGSPAWPGPDWRRRIFVLLCHAIPSSGLQSPPLGTSVSQPLCSTLTLFSDFPHFPHIS